MSEDEKNDHKASSKPKYSLRASVVHNKLEITLHDKSTKKMYSASFDQNALKNSGFGTEQSQDLNNVQTFIETAKNGHKQLKFSINTANDAAIINVAKADDFFPMKIALKLKQKPRDKVDILEEHILDLQSENVQLKDKICELEQIFDRNAFGQFLRFSKFDTSGHFTKLNLESAVYHKNIDLNNGGLRFKYNGMYKITINHRAGNNANDTWTHFWVKSDKGAVVGCSNKTGNTHGTAPQPHS
eukprot:UN02965